MSRSFLAVALLVALPALARAAGPDYAGYQALLDKYLVRLDPRSPVTDTRFDYERLYLDERIFQTHRSPTLEKIRSAMFAVEPAALAPADRLAWTINAYNFSVIERATMRLLIPRKRFLRYHTVEEMQAPEGPFFAAPVAVLDGRRCSLAELERRYVYGDTTAMLQPRGMATDPRRSLALCSGHAGDPPLAPRAYRGDSLEAQLDAAARVALAQPRFVRWHEDSKRLDVSDYLAQRRIDFGGTIDGIIPFVERFGPAEARKAIRRYKVGHVAMVLPVERALNQAPHARPMSEAPGAGTN